MGWIVKHLEGGNWHVIKTEVMVPAKPGPGVEHKEIFLAISDGLPEQEAAEIYVDCERKKGNLILRLTGPAEVKVHPLGLKQVTFITAEGCTTKEVNL